MTMNDNMPLGERLTPDQVAHLAKIARDQVHEDDRDRFFKYAADVLRGIRQISATDVRHAAGFALGKLGR